MSAHPSDQLHDYLNAFGASGKLRHTRLAELVSRYGEIGRELGCGHWGCVYELDAPWVLKVTFDPQEGAMWLQLAELAEEDPPVMYGAARVKELMRLRPDEVVLLYNHETGETEQERVPVHAIVREAVMPFRLRGRPSALTLRILGDEHQIKALSEVLGEYRAGANMAIHPQAGDMQRRSAWERMGAAAQVMMVDFPDAAFALGRTLRYLTNRRIALPDLHAGNVGWRIHETIEGRTAPPGLVILDPGHSPTPPELQQRIPEFELNRSLRRRAAR